MQKERAKPTTISLKWCHGFTWKYPPHSLVLCAGDTIWESCGAFKRWVASTRGPGGGALNMTAWCLILVCCDVGDVRSIPHSPTSRTMPCLSQPCQYGTVSRNKQIFAPLSCFGQVFRLHNNTKLTNKVLISHTGWNPLCSDTFSHFSVRSFLH